VLIFPLVTAPVGLAAILVVTLLIAIRVRHAASDADGLLQYQDRLPSRLDASGGRPRIAVGDL